MYQLTSTDTYIITNMNENVKTPFGGPFLALNLVFWLVIEQPAAIDSAVIPVNHHGLAFRLYLFRPLVGNDVRVGLHSGVRGHKEIVRSPVGEGRNSAHLVLA